MTCEGPFCAREATAANEGRVRAACVDGVKRVFCSARCYKLYANRCEDGFTPGHRDFYNGQISYPKQAQDEERAAARDERDLDLDLDLDSDFDDDVDAGVDDGEDVDPWEDQRRQFFALAPKAE